MVKYMSHYDNDLYPETPDEDVIPWQCFTRNFLSNDLPYDDEVKEICSDNIKKLVDLRPYM